MSVSIIVIGAGNMMVSSIKTAIYKKYGTKK